MKTEIFGPLLPILTLRDINEALSAIKTEEKPLALYFFGKSTAMQEEVIRTVSFGGGSMNDTLYHLANPHLPFGGRSEEHTSELQSRGHLVCRLLLEKKKEGEAASSSRRTETKYTTSSTAVAASHHSTYTRSRDPSKPVHRSTSPSTRSTTQIRRHTP